MAFFKYLWLGICVILVSACATSIQSSSNPVTVDSGVKWALLPIANHTDTPQAGLAAESILEHQLRLRGISNLQHYPAALTRDSLFEPTERKVTEEAEKWARDQGVRYALVGSIQEWRYKVGIDGEPAVGVALKVVDLQSGQVVWSASGAKSGWSRQALSAVAQAVLADMLATIALPTTSLNK
jgi:TolB-like protein